MMPRKEEKKKLNTITKILCAATACATLSVPMFVAPSAFAQDAAPMNTTPTLPAAEELNASPNISIDAAHFPDAVFRDYIKRYYDSNKDGVLSPTEITNLTDLVVVGVDAISITSLKGIEYFTNMVSLTVENTKVVSLDLSANPLLKKLTLHNNLLTSLDISKNTALERFYFRNNLVKFDNFDFTNNKKLLVVDIQDNDISKINISTLADLNILRLSNAGISTIDVSKNTKLEILQLPNNKLTNIDISKNPNLVHVELENNKLTSFALPQKVWLRVLKLDNNKIPFIDMRNVTAAGQMGLSIENSGTLGVLAPKYTTYTVADQTYTVEGDSLDFAKVAPGIDMSRIKNLTGASLTGTVLTPTTSSLQAKYTYQMNADDAKKVGTMNVTVKFAKEPDILPVQSVDILESDFTITPGESKKLNALVVTADPTPYTVTWKSSNTAVATIDTKGVVKAVAPGTTTITARVGDKSAQITVTVAKGKRFTDVLDTSPFAKEIYWLADKGITQGYADGRFGYNDQLNRQDMAVFLYRLARMHGVAGVATYTPTEAEYARFSDVKKGQFASKEILWLAKTGITTGVNGKFMGTSKLNRTELAIFLYRYAVLAGKGSASSYVPTAADYAKFKDVKQGQFGAKEILWLAKNGITTGNSDGTFDVNGRMTRSAMAAFLYRINQLF